MWRNSESYREWANQTHEQLTQGSEAQVPCGDCTACCGSNQFIHVRKQEPAYTVIPSTMLVAAPGSDSDFLLGHDAQGICPMLTDATCTIYTDRPHACRTYDCRIFSASGVYPDSSQPHIATRARQWAFDYANHEDQAAHQANQRAGAYLVEHQHFLFGGQVNEIQISLSALKVRALFQPTENASTTDSEGATLLERVKAALQP